MKPLKFVGNSLECIKAFPLNARKEAGVQLHMVQQGFDPHDWKPMAIIGAGVREIRIRDEVGAFRVIYVARIEDAVCMRSRRRPSKPRDGISSSPPNGSESSK